VVRAWRDGIARDMATEFCAVDVALDCIEYLCRISHSRPPP